jgi:hypothetical protein
MTDEERLNDEEQEEEKHEEEAEKPQARLSTTAIARGVAAPRISTTGVLDLRGVPPEQVRAIRRISTTGIILADEANREALGQIRISTTGNIAFVRPGFRVIIAPDLQITKGMVEGMPAGQKLLFTGTVFFKPDVPPGLVAEKLDEVEILGVLVACETVLGVLLGKGETSGATIALPDDVGPVLRSVGENKWSRDYLARLGDGTTYINIGQTRLADDIPEDLLDRKIAAYYNVGHTVAPAPLLALLKARCPTNLGRFSEPREEESEEDEEE